MATGHQQMSTGLVQYLLNTGSFAALFSTTTAKLQIYTGAAPATADAAPTGTLAATVLGPAGAYLIFGAAVAGVIAKGTGVWDDHSGTNAGGTLGYYRLILNADGAGSSTTDPRVQGTISTGGADMNVGSTTLAPGATFTVNTFTQTLSPNVAA